LFTHGRYTNKNECQIHIPFFSVHEKFKGRGFGRNIIESLKEEASKGNFCIDECRKYKKCCSVERTTSSVGFWNKMGFYQIEQKDFPKVKFSRKKLHL
jgi:GNAT superfamily N-acetyltransferase